jgi:threonine synthase
LRYKGVTVYILDETTLMRTGTLKSIDGVVSIARSLQRGDRRVVLETGGNTGTALCAYGSRMGMELFVFMPSENLYLLDSEIFNSSGVHLVAVDKPGMVKPVADEFTKSTRYARHIPETPWRYEAAMFRGLFILEFCLLHGCFDWMSQTISAAFGPIGIYSVLQAFTDELGGLPRFLGIQQKANCPMYQSWKSGSEEIKPVELKSTSQLLTRVMYDSKPHTYATYRDLRDVLELTGGDLDTIDHEEFARLMDYRFKGLNIIETLAENDINVTMMNGSIVEKTGLIAVAGTLKAIDSGRIPAGSRVLCNLTSARSLADGKAMPEKRINSIEEAVEYSLEVRERNHDA